MQWLLDTNAWIKLLKASSQELTRRVMTKHDGDLLLCSIVKAELWHGAHKYSNRERRLKLLDQIFARHHSLPFDDDAACHYADIRYQLETLGQCIGPNDLKIAAICRANRIALVTANTNEFARVPGLVIEDWSLPE